MARTSRRKQPRIIEKTPAKSARERQDPAAAYVRLSVEENEGDTIETQLETLKQYIEDSKNMYLEEVYIDNGYSGTTFDRPAFTSMMTDVRSGRIRCIVVKDLSRFGRNFIESGYYIETLLPKLNARLVAVTDDFDSSRQSDQDALSVPIKNMINDFYAKDYSKKISDMNAARRRSGKYTIEKAMYGYAVDKEKDEYYVNPDTAPVVQMIFRWYLTGMKCGTIAKKLNKLGVMTPQEYKCKNEFGCEMRWNPNWNPGKVIMVLRRDAYVGDRVLGVKLSALYKNYHLKTMPREEWTIYKDNHDAIVTREDFAAVQEKLDAQVERRNAEIQHGKKVNPEIENLFLGMIYCGNCGRCMRIEKRRYNHGIIKTEGAAYVCKGRQGPNNQLGCRMTIELDYLKIIVHDQIRMMVDLLLDRQKVVQKIRRLQNDKNPVHKYKMRISSLLMKEDQCGEKIARLYEDLASGILEKDDYISLKESYQKEREQYAEKITEYRNLLNEAQANMDRLDSIIEIIKVKFEHLELTRELLEYMIDRIIVYDEHRIEIKFRFDDLFKNITDIAEGGDTE